MWCGVAGHGRILHRRRFVSFINSTVYIRAHTYICADSRNPNPNTNNGKAAKHNMWCASSLSHGIYITYHPAPQTQHLSRFET